MSISSRKKTILQKRTILLKKDDFTKIKYNFTVKGYLKK